MKQNGEREVPAASGPAGDDGVLAGVVLSCETHPRATAGGSRPHLLSKGSFSIKCVSFKSHDSRVGRGRLAGKAGQPCWQRAGLRGRRGSDLFLHWVVALKDRTHHRRDEEMWFPF